MSEGSRKQFNVAIDADRIRYMKILAAESGRTLCDLMEEAIDLLRIRNTPLAK